MYQIKPVNGVGLECVVNCRQLQDLQKAHVVNDNTGDKEVGNIPSFNPKVKLKETSNTHKYATWAKGQTFAMVQSTIASMGTDQSDRLSNIFRVLTIVHPM